MSHIRWNTSDSLKQFALILLRKMAFVALAWLVIYFLSQPMRREQGLNVLPLFGMPLGALAGLVAGWYLATNAVEDSDLQGLPLWCLLVTGSVLPVWLVEGVLKLFTHWPVNFGGWMMLTAATVMALASAVWIANAQE
jgi:hypothetical protein